MPRLSYFSVFVRSVLIQRQQEAERARIAKIRAERAQRRE